MEKQLLRFFSFLGKHWGKLLIGFLLLLLAGFLLFDWSTGLGARTSTQTTITRTYSDGVQTTVTETSARGKTLWDWLDLVVVPAALGIGTLWFNRQAAKREAISREDRYREEVLQKYFDNMSELLIANTLRDEFADWTVSETMQSPIVNVAQVRTVTALNRVDRRRRNEILGYLRAADLLTGSRALLHHATLELVDLSGAFLYEANLRKANLTRANLNNAYLLKADLEDAVLNETILKSALLIGANLTGAWLVKAVLTGSMLSGAILKEAQFLGTNLSNVDLFQADLSGSNLSGANLMGANVTPAQLRQAISLKGAIMPDGRRYEPGMLDGLDDWPPRDA